jgi:lipoate-protein ligase A
VSTQWRLLSDAASSGPWNMGVDEALLATAAAGGPPSLRLYAWDGPWLSLGYAQRLGKAREESCRRAGVGIVRRTTGGRAVLHGADLSYAVAAPEALLPQSLEASYACIALGLQRALGAIGVAVEGASRPARGGAAVGFDCFAEPVQHELCAGGLKLVGSAQRRAHGAVLQHGSIRLGPDPAMAASAVGVEAAAATSLLELGCAASPDALREALSNALSAVLEAELVGGTLSPAEVASARRRGVAGGRIPNPITRGDSSRGLYAGR